MHLPILLICTPLSLLGTCIAVIKKKITIKATNRRKSVVWLAVPEEEAIMVGTYGSRPPKPEVAILHFNPRAGRRDNRKQGEPINSQNPLTVTCFLQRCSSFKSFLNLHKLYHQLRTNCSNKRAYGGTFLIQTTTAPAIHPHLPQ